MERLTEWNREHTHGQVRGNCDAITRLAEYEDAEEQGLLLRLPAPLDGVESFSLDGKEVWFRLPCNVGAEVYCILERRTKCTEHNQELDDYSCQGCECLECDSRKEKYIQPQKIYSLEWIVANIGKFGKTVFLTPKEAEQALEQMGE